MEKTAVNKLSEVDQKYPAYLVTSPSNMYPIYAILCHKQTNGGLLFESNFLKAIEEEYDSDVDSIVYVAENPIANNVPTMHKYKVKATIGGFTEEFFLYPLYIY